MKFRISILLSCVTIVAAIQACSKRGNEASQLYPNQRWTMHERGEIEWQLNKDSLKGHTDNIEMSGRQVSSIISYGVDSLGLYHMNRELIWPCLRINLKKSDPDWMRYRAYLKRNYADDILPVPQINGKPLSLNKAVAVKLNGTLQVIYKKFEGVTFTRTVFPSTRQAFLCELWTFTNHETSAVSLSIDKLNKSETEQGFYGEYEIGVKADTLQVTRIEKGQTISFGIYFEAHKINDKLNFGVNNELVLRKNFIDEMKGSLQLNTPDSLLNSAFLFAKIRTSESLFDTKIGLVHSPGGGRYYAGVWANDQVEYAGPFFPFLGYKDANEASLNAYKIFAGDMKPGVYKPLWSSHEMEGDLTCCGKDRGDAAMYLFGASRFLSALGDAKVAVSFFPALDWCVEYNHSRLNSGGVVASETDEMEGRIATGDANLATSSLYYGGLRSAGNLATSIGLSRIVAAIYASYADPLKDSIESYFGATQLAGG